MALRPETVFYDGRCGLCHSFVRFAARRDASGRFRFAPLGGELFRAVVPSGEQARLPDSVVVQTAEGKLLRSQAVLHVLRHLGCGWRITAAVLGVVPAALLDAVYDAAARLRRRFFAPPADVCPVVPEHLRQRFLP